MPTMLSRTNMLTLPTRSPSYAALMRYSTAPVSHTSERAVRALTARPIALKSRPSTHTYLSRTLSPPTRCFRSNQVSSRLILPCCSKLSFLASLYAHPFHPRQTPSIRSTTFQIILQHRRSQVFRPSPATYFYHHPLSFHSSSPLADQHRALISAHISSMDCLNVALFSRAEVRSYSYEV